MAAAVIALPKTLMGGGDPDLDRTNKVGALLVELKAHEDVQDTWERTKHYFAEAGVDPEKTHITLGQHLRVNGDKESFLDYAAANALLTREYRIPFVVPKLSGI